MLDINITTCAICISFFVPIAASPQAEPHTDTVEFTSGGEIARGYLALPTTPGPYSAILILPADAGFDESVAEEARTFAEMGYAALAVDFYRGRAATNDEDAHELARGLPEDRAQRDAQAAFAFLAARNDVDPRHIGVIGRQIGGWFALQLAIHEPRLAACAVSDTGLPTDPADLARIRAPILLNFGALNSGISAERIDAFATDLRTRGVSVDAKTFADVPADFENPGAQPPPLKGAYGPADVTAYIQSSKAEAFARVEAHAREAAFFFRHLPR